MPKFFVNQRIQHFLNPVQKMGRTMSCGHRFCADRSGAKTLNPRVQGTLCDKKERPPFSGGHSFLHCRRWDLNPLFTILENNRFPMNIAKSRADSFLLFANMANIYHKSTVYATQCNTKCNTKITILLTAPSH